MPRIAVPNRVRDPLPYKVDDGLGDVGAQVNVQVLKRLAGHQGIRACFSRDSAPRVGQGLLLGETRAHMHEMQKFTASYGIGVLDVKAPETWTANAHV